MTSGFSTLNVPFTAVARAMVTCRSRQPAVIRAKRSLLMVCTSLSWSNESDRTNRLTYTRVGPYFRPKLQIEDCRLQNQQQSLAFSNLQSAIGNRWSGTLNSHLLPLGGHR